LCLSDVYAFVKELENVFFDLVSVNTGKA
jgi:hypothetical protein